MTFGKPKWLRACSKPRPGWAASSASIRGMAVATGSQLQIFHGLFTRMPMRKRTKPPSTSAQTRRSMSLPMRSPPVLLEPYGERCDPDVPSASL